MLEVGITQFKSLESFKNQKSAIGSKPCFIITGSEFDNDDNFKLIANLFVDFFRGEVVNNINLMGIDHVIGLASNGTGSFFFRNYSVKLKKSGSKVPKVELEEMGPCFEFKIRRFKWGDPDLRKKTYPPRQYKKNKKHVTNVMRETTSRIHLGKQNIDDVTKTVIPPKALKNKRKRMEANEEIDVDVQSDNQHDKKKRKIEDNVDI
jgi:ribosome production factor 2